MPIYIANCGPRKINPQNMDRSHPILATWLSRGHVWGAGMPNSGTQTVATQNSGDPHPLLEPVSFLDLFLSGPPELRQFSPSPLFVDSGMVPIRCWFVASRARSVPYGSLLCTQMFSLRPQLVVRKIRAAPIKSQLCRKPVWCGAHVAHSQNGGCGLPSALEPKWCSAHVAYS